MTASDRAGLSVATRSIALVALCAVLVPSRLLAQASVYYVYDDLNRLVAVVDQQGNAATYTYDAVGNILRIERFDATGGPGGAAISMFTPSAGAVGTTVQVFGIGFGAGITQNSLFFGGRAATLITAAPNRLVANVPVGAMTGPITVATPRGSAASSRVFHVLGALAIDPQTVTPRVTERVAFVAAEAGAPVSTVRWAVNGLTGGNPSVGTITADGLYTAPAAVPVPPAVTITATHADDATLSASALVTILPALPLLLTARPVSVAAAAPPLVMDRSVSAAVSVRANAPRGATLGLSPAVSVEIQPLVLEVAPAAAVPGATIVLTLTGRGLSGATSLVFLRDNAVDPSLAVANMSVTADGTQVTADVIVGATASAGARVVQIVTPERASSRAGTGGNVFTVQ